MTIHFEHVINGIPTLLGIVPTDELKTPADILKEGVTFFSKWISRMGGIVAFVGAVKVAIATRTEDEREIMNAALICASGFMIVEAVSGSLNLFNIPKTYSEAAANAEFKSITNFIGTWMRRVGGIGFMVGGFNFGFSIKNNDAGTKVSALKGMTAGAIVMGVSTLLSSFVS